MSEDLSLPQPSFRKDLQDLDEKWSLKMARLEALITLGQRPSPYVAFSPVKAPVTHGPSAVSLSQAPFLLSAVPSGQAGPASGPDRTCVSATATTTSVGMTSLLENLYPDTDVDATEPVFAQPGPVSYGDTLPLTLSRSPVPVIYLRNQLRKVNYQTWKINRMWMPETLTGLLVKTRITEKQSGV